jgi:hypothetical protein
VEIIRKLSDRERALIVQELKKAESVDELWALSFLWVVDARLRLEEFYENNRTRTADVTFKE